jgi:hypothetical protein
MIGNQYNNLNQQIALSIAFFTGYLWVYSQHVTLYKTINFSNYFKLNHFAIKHRFDWANLTVRANFSCCCPYAIMSNPEYDMILLSYIDRGECIRPRQSHVEYIIRNTQDNDYAKYLLFSSMKDKLNMSLSKRTI